MSDRNPPNSRRRPQDRAVGQLNLLPRRQLIHQAVQAEIKDFIVQQKLRPGDALPSEGDLAAQLGVSRNSVREAVKALEGLGVIGVRAGAGLYVRDFSIDVLLDHLTYGVLFDIQSLRDIAGVRLALEMGMTRAIVRDLSDEHLEGIDLILAKWRIAAERGDYPADLDRAFHESLLAATDNVLATKILDAFWRMFYEARQHAMVSEVDDPMVTYRAHVAILEALKDRDENQVAQAIDEHHKGIARRIADVGAPDRKLN